MTTRLRTSLLLGLACCGLLLVGCDSDDPADGDPVRFDGVFIASDVRVDGAARSADAASERSSQGGCCYRFTLDIANDAGGVISGTGTVQELNQDGTDAGRNWAVAVSGTTEGDRVEMEMPTEEGFPATAFEGTVSAGGDAITGTFTSQFLGGRSAVFERVP